METILQRNSGFFREEIMHKELEILSKEKNHCTSLSFILPRASDIANLELQTLTPFHNPYAN